VSSDGAAVAVVIVLLIGLAATAFWIWAIVDVVKVPDDSMFKTGNKLVWVLVVVLAQVIGAIIYLVVGRPSPDSRAARPPASREPNQPPPPPPGAVG
jgi:type VI protein secretion system component VasK